MKFGWIKDIARNSAVPITEAFWMIGSGRISPSPTAMMKQSLFNSIASACIYMISTSMSEAPLKVYRRTKQGDIELEDHWLAQLLRRPNAFLSSFEIWELTGVYINTAGAAYFELVRTHDNPTAPVVEMYPLRPDKIDAVVDPKQFITAYKYRPDNAGEVTYQPWQILRIPYLDPFNLADEISPASRAAKEINIDYTATEFTSKFLSNYGVPPLIISTDQELLPDQADDIEERWWQKFNPLRGMLGKTAVLGKGSKPVQLGHSFKDMEFESLRNFVETRICGAFGVDPVLLPSWTGIKYGGKYSNYSEARKHLWDETIIPLLRRIESKINAQLLSHEIDIYCKFDLSQVQALQENENEKAKRIVALFEAGVISKNEAREAAGYDALPDGDQFEGDSVGQVTETEDKSSISRIEQLAPDDKKKYAQRILKMQEALIIDCQRDFSDFFLNKKSELAGAIQQNVLTEEELENTERELNEIIAGWDEELTEIARRNILLAVTVGGEVAADLIGSTFDGYHPEIKTYIESYTSKFIQGLAETTRKDFRNLLIKAQTEGWSVPRLRDKIRELMNNYSRSRAEMIARTEMIRASNAGAKISYRQAGVKELEWLYTSDRRTCPYCRAMNGRIVRIEKPFAEKGDTVTGKDEEGNEVHYKVTYESVQYPPLHPRCRCTIIPVIR